MEASATIGYIKSQDYIAEWCKPYYDVKNFKQEKKQFASKQEKADKIIKQACGTNMMLSEDASLASFKTITSDQMDKQFKNLNTPGITKKDFCEAIDEEAKPFAKEQMAKYVRFHPNF
jgi:hypothetical protein